jgi:serine/threonine protein kinase
MIDINYQMGNMLCPTSRTEKMQTASEQLTDELRSKFTRISFKEDQGNSHGTIVSKSDILKDYRVISKIGKGLFSEVFYAIDSSGRKVAIKVIQKKKFVKEKEIQKIIVEKEILKRVEHRSVLKLYRTMQTKSHIYFILEYGDKGTLANLIGAKRLSPDEIRVIVAQIIEALFYLHSKGIIYGDLKADNILVNKNGVVKLCDFNLSGTCTLLSKSIQGTIKYIAPEIIEGKDRDTLSDFWSLGVLIYLMCYKKYPFDGNNDTELLFNITNHKLKPEAREVKMPKHLRHLILSLLVKNPEARIGKSMKDFVNHPFFENFDWKNFAKISKNFSYTDGIPLCEDQGDVSTSQSNSENEVFSQDSHSKFMYHIEDFTYENTKLVDNIGSRKEKVTMKESHSSRGRRN